MTAPLTLLRDWDNWVRGFISLCLNVGRLRRQRNQVVFQFEGRLQIVLPEARYRDLLTASGRSRIRQCIKYSTRPAAEALLRRTVFGLLQTGHIDPRGSIVDIGSWIGDNTIVWARLLKDDGAVYAVDPSRANLDFGKKVADLNHVTNIRWVQAVCADRPGLKVNLCGDLDHAQFSDTAGDHTRNFVTTTLDEIVPDASHARISLLHVDVEGFEKKVLLGAKRIINASKPIIVFEQHISKEEVHEVIDAFRDADYRVFMINEVIPGCDLDCRNFVAFPAARDLPKLERAAQSHGRAERIWYATLGPTLIAVGDRADSSDAATA
jgi:FkbM family methyltransferase